MLTYNNATSFVPSAQDVLSILIEYDIDMMIVGSSVAKSYGLLDDTKDIDLLLYNSENNKKKLHLFLNQFFNIANFDQILELHAFTLVCKNKEIIDVFIDGTEPKSNCSCKLRYNTLLDNSMKKNINNLTINMIGLQDYIACVSFLIKCLEKQDYNKNGVSMYNKVEKYNKILQRYKEKYTL